MVNIVINQEIEFLEEKSAWQGVKRVAGKGIWKKAGYLRG